MPKHERLVLIAWLHGAARAADHGATQLDLRYDGEIGSGSDNHSINVGVRLGW